MSVSLDEILSSTREGLASLHGRRATLERDLASAVPPPSFRAALRKSAAVAVVAEVKRRSPSAGSIREDLEPAERAALYAAHGAAAVSVLTDGPYFGGSIEDLQAAVQRCPVPVLRKDFILDRLQIIEARAAGAAAVLLIVRALGRQLRSMIGYAAEVGIDALIEVHSPRELGAALDAGGTIIGVNSRDLDSFKVDTEAAWKIVSEVPADLIAVAESGMATREDVVRAAEAGADAVLIGTALSAAAAPEVLLDQLTRVGRRDR
jgi:indole-3-glycerol phosphate synthase